MFGYKNLNSRLCSLEFLLCFSYNREYLVEMSDYMEEKIFSLLKQGYSFEEIQNELQLSSTEMSSFLNSINNSIHEHYNHIKFYENGKKRFSSKKLNESGVYTQKDSNHYRAVIISDTHFGTKKENINLLEKVYDFCISNDIHNIFHLGDLVDGTTGAQEYKELDPRGQIEHVIKDYPNDKSILNFILLGNHDLDIIATEPTLHDSIIDNRKDMICLGYGTNEFYVKNDFVVLKHLILIDKSNNNYNGKLIFKGHSHQMKVIDDLNNYIVHVPSLSDLQIINTLPGFLLVDLEFYNGYVFETLITHYGIIDNNLINMNTAKINLKSHRKEDNIEREEVLVKVKH